MENTRKVAGHYTLADLEGGILNGLKAAGKDLDSLSVDDLAPIDEFHIRGRDSTEELASWIEPGETDRVLDVGCGIGGTARYLAESRACSVVGIDLTPEYCRVAEMLSKKVGMADRTSFKEASALEIPFSDAEFDVVWTEHVQMNIADKSAFYNEMARVLKPEGRLVFHDIFAGESLDGFQYPVPWAFDASISHLEKPVVVENILQKLGFKKLKWEDRTKESAEFFRLVLEKLNSHTPMPIGIHLLMGDDSRQKIVNLTDNLESGRLQVIAAVLKR